MATGYTNSTKNKKIKEDIKALHDIATTTKDGLMSAGDKKKLDGIATNANNYSHPGYTARTGVPTSNQTPGFGGTFSISQPISDDKGHITAVNSRTVTIPSATATTSANGLMSSSDKKKLDGIATNANNYSHPSYTERTGVPTSNQTPGFGGTFSISQPISDDKGHITAVNSRTVTIPSATATTSANGLMSSSDKTKLNGIATNANNYSHPTTSGNKHIPSGGSSGQVLKWSADGTAAWANQSSLSVGSATSASSATNATKATQDANGNTITSTYALKSIYGDSEISRGRVTGTYAYVGTGSFAFGNSVYASGDYSHAEGSNTSASYACSHAEGNGTRAAAPSAHAEGTDTSAIGDHSHAGGRGSVADGTMSFATGCFTYARDYQVAIGHWNDQQLTGSSYEGITGNTVFVIGNGTSSDQSNAFRVTDDGYVHAKHTTVSNGADYAEYFEWADKNPDNEDRVGYFVTFDEENEEKIRFANKDEYILGIVSGAPSVVGNGDECWKGRYILDNFGRYIEESFEYEEPVVDKETGEETKVKKTGTKWKETPDYDSTIKYIPRRSRPEWDAVGMLGVLSVYDDGTCKVNGYCKCADGGIATVSETGYRVIKRVTDNIVKVVLK